ncbi:hypothetical protein SAMD00019534_038600 [Acytostelium subglobosum LB1]|uniref:hypothetical protein n=1 Tax=Acytostelium subglobosum LB1 TaxID=1410327 RepID=UPI00064506BA|nr:hypothetical protein SAMD00019534_038600 [Acytostelium subglobosum LB1]GAM20685.1 hypothetical protein SAMD00019534_038600 [Acytostelium subglobosum LB1]|eukprot:XP_012760206.1 hypothetical protein SAMD00019534_038600 [Acytostelium subglobosum LB1]
MDLPPPQYPPPLKLPPLPSKPNGQPPPPPSSAKPTSAGPMISAPPPLLHTLPALPKPAPPGTSSLGQKPLAPPPQQQQPLSPNYSKPPAKQPPPLPPSLATGTATTKSLGSIPLPALPSINNLPPPPPQMTLPPLPSQMTLPPPPPPLSAPISTPVSLPPPPPMGSQQLPPQQLPPPPLQQQQQTPTKTPPPLMPRPVSLNFKTPPPLLPTQSPISPHSSGAIASNPMRASSESAYTSPATSNRNSMDVGAPIMEFPEMITQNRVAEENYNYLNDIYHKIQKRSQSSTATSREGNSLAEAFKNYGTMLIAQSDNELGQCMFKIGDLHRDIELFRQRCDIQSISGLRTAVEQYVTRDIKVVRSSKKNYDKVRSMYDNLETKCLSNTAKGKGVNLVRQAELQQERDYLRGRVSIVGNETQATVRLATDSNSVEMMEQVVEYVEGLQSMAKALHEQLDSMQPSFAQYKKEAQRRRSELDRAIEHQKQVTISTANSPAIVAASLGTAAPGKERVTSTELERDVIGEDPKRTQVRRFVIAERNYVAGLNTLVQVYLNSLRTDDRLFSKIFKEDEVAIFSNVEALLTHQNKFLEDLDSCLKQYGEPSAPTLASVFFKASPKLMQLYSVYIGNFSKALHTINRVKQSKNFQQFLKTCEEKSDGADLDSLIPTPLSRVTSYLIILQDLKDNSANQDELDMIMEAQEKMKTLGDLVGQSHNLIQMMKLQQSLIGFDALLVQEGRYLIKEGGASVSQGANAPSSNMHMLLMSDLIILCKKQNALFPSMLSYDSGSNNSSAGNSSSSHGFKYKYISKIDLQNNMEVKESKEDRSLVVTCGAANLPTVFNLTFDNKSLRDDWMSAITKASYKINQNKLFGIPLEQLYLRPSEQGRPIPSFVQRIIDYLSEYGCTEEGVFRLSANQRILDSSKSEIEAGVELDYSELDVHTVACLLKLWVRNLPEPLLTYKQFDSFVDIANVSPMSQKYLAIKSEMEKLPQFNRFCTFYLMRMLTKVAEQSSINKMTPNNISIVFATLLLRKKGASPLDCTAFNTIFGLVEAFMTGFQVIFSSVEQEMQQYQSDAANNSGYRRSAKLHAISSPDTSPTISRRTAPVVSEDSDSDGEESYPFGTGLDGNKQGVSITIQLGEIVKQGYLTKKGAMRRNWTKRWFVLKQNYLFYFKTSRDKKPKGIIHLVNIAVQKSYYKPFCMAIRESTENREFLICGSSQSEIDEWISSVTKCSSSTKQQLIE